MNINVYKENKEQSFNDLIKYACVYALIRAFKLQPNHCIIYILENA